VWAVFFLSGNCALPRLDTGEKKIGSGIDVNEANSQARDKIDTDGNFNKENLLI
jgi:hypothetical protein